MIEIRFLVSCKFEESEKTEDVEQVLQSCAVRKDSFSGFDIAALVESDPQARVSLQRALASQRLQDLKAQRRQLREQLAALEASDVDGPEDLRTTESLGGGVSDPTGKKRGNRDEALGIRSGENGLGEKEGGVEERGKKRVRFEDRPRKEGPRASRLGEATGMLETVGIS